MSRKIRLKKPITPKNLPIQIPSLSMCTCSQNAEQSDPRLPDVNNDEYVVLENVWTPERTISSHNQLMALIEEPLFLTGKAEWQEKELRANTRELEMCKHFVKKLTPEYLCSFAQALITKKEQHIEEMHKMPVTFYMWYSVYGSHSFLCYDFLSGKVATLPFGKGLIVHNQPHLHTFMRKFLKLKRHYIITRILHAKNQQDNPIECSDQELLNRYKKFVQEMGSSKTRWLPKRLMM